MSRSQEPLLARRPSSDNDRDIAEEDALLSEPKADQAGKGRRWMEIGLTVWGLVATVVIVILAVLYDQSRRVPTQPQSSVPQGKRNLIFMVSDGMGPTSLALTRYYRQERDGLHFDDTLVLDKYEVGKSRTRSTSSLITDSAAGATAFSCGKKSYNGAISTLPDHTPCGTVMEAAKRAGYMTGLVVTTRITDATPACFAAHVNKREEEDRIAEQLLGDYPLGQTVDIMLGAGRCHFLPNTTKGSCRKDDKDMIARAREKGYSYVGNRDDFDALNFGNAVDLPMLGLFELEDIPYEIDRRFQNDIYPSLKDMSRTALTALKEATRDSDKGFFLMIEGSRIDHSGHLNDPSAQVHEVLAYDEAFGEVIDFLEKDDTQGILVATSDHETGGLATAKQLQPYVYPVYRWFPGVLTNVTHSVSWMAHQYASYVREREEAVPPADTVAPTSTSDELAARDVSEFLRQLIEENLGIHDSEDEEIQLLIDKPLIFAVWIFSDMISRRAQTGWSTHGHSGADVNVYASDAEVAKALQGNHENTEVGKFLRDYLDVDVDAITEELKEKGTQWDQQYAAEGGSWMGRRPEDGERTDGGSHLERYQGNFKMRMHRH